LEFFLKSVSRRAAEPQRRKVFEKETSFFLCALAALRENFLSLKNQADCIGRRAPGILDMGTRNACRIRDWVEKPEEICLSMA
jgi:hypothetical protein